ncbi:MAG TPA: protein kinase, partial [Urbifossiella sp.]|nr:protein kinase [Urbifossiella sp.]
MTEPEATPLLAPALVQSPDDHDDTVRFHARTVSPGPVVGRDAGPVAVPGYEGLEELGRGSMGVVYRARQAGLGRPVALKMILADTRADREALDRFTSEARILASLQHPNIVQVYEIDLGHRPPYFSMELVEGGTLADRLGGRPQPPRVAAALVRTLARAVQAAHVRGIVHRDLKPGNVLIPAADAHGSTIGRITAALGLQPPDLGHASPKITDFGLAKDLHAGDDQTASGVVMGTPNYMAPEQAEGKSKGVGPPADVYSLGAILYEALTGRPPFTGESSMDTFIQIFHAEPVSPSRLQPRIPRDLETICLKCLHKVPGRRYPTAGELADDLDRLLAGEPILARPTPLHERAAKWARRRPALAASAAFAVVAVLGLAGAAAWHQVELQHRLGAAVADERDSRAAEAAAAERERQARLRGTATELVRDAEAALAANDWAGGSVPLARAREQVGDEPELADLRERVDALRTRADRQRGDHERLETFLDRRNDALFHATLFTGSTPAAAAHDTRAAATAALARFGVAPAAPGRPAVDSPFYTAAQKAEVVEGCYELLVVLAAACESAPEAVRLLDQAADLGPPTRALHRRKARYLAGMGQAEAAGRERDRAAATIPTTALDHFLLGQELYRAGEYRPAVAALEGALQLRPDHFWARYYLGLCWLKSGQPGQTVTCLTACLAQRRDFPWLHLL